MLEIMDPLVVRALYVGLNAVSRATVTPSPVTDECGVRTELDHFPMPQRNQVVSAVAKIGHRFVNLCHRAEEIVVVAQNEKYGAFTTGRGDFLEMSDELFRVGYVAGDQGGIVADSSQLLKKLIFLFGIHPVEVNVGKPEKFACRVI